MLCYWRNGHLRSMILVRGTRSLQAGQLCCLRLCFQQAATLFRRKDRFQSVGLHQPRTIVAASHQLRCLSHAQRYLHRLCFASIWLRRNQRLYRGAARSRKGSVGFAPTKEPKASHLRSHSTDYCSVAHTDENGGISKEHLRCETTGSSMSARRSSWPQSSTCPSPSKVGSHRHLHSALTMAPL